MTSHNNPFTILDIPVSFAVDGATLRQRYFALQQQYHPDRWKTGTEKLAAANKAAAANAAYQTLLDPYQRALAMLRLAGEELPGETVSDPTLLEQSMADREAITEADDPAALQPGFKNRQAAAYAKMVAAFAAEEYTVARLAALEYRYLSKLISH